MAARSSLLFTAGIYLLISRDFRRCLGLLGDVYRTVRRKSLCYLHKNLKIDNKVVILRYSVTVFLLPFCVLTFTYAEICCSIWRNREVMVLASHERQQALTKEGRSQTTLISKAKINTVKQTLAVVTLYAASSIPFVGCQLWATWDPFASSSAFFDGPIFTILSLLSSLTSCVNPWIYLTFSYELRAALIKFLRSLIKRDRTSRFVLTVAGLFCCILFQNEHQAMLIQTKRGPPKGLPSFPECLATQVLSFIVPMRTIEILDFSNNWRQQKSLQMTEHKGTSFAHSCVKVPVDPYSRQPTPLYERPKIVHRTNAKSEKPAKMTTALGKRHEYRPNNKPCSRLDNRCSVELENAREDYSSFLEFIESIPDYMEVHHLSNEQFKQKLDYLKRKQRMLLKNLRNCLEQDERVELVTIRGSERSKSPREKCCASDLMTKGTELTLKGKCCNLEESRAKSPLLYPLGSFSRLAEDQDFLTYRCKYRDKTAKTRRNEEILSASKDWSSGSESKCGGDSLESDDQEISVETKSLPPRSPKRWHPTLPKPFSFTLREDAEKYMSLVEQQAAEEYESSRPGKKNPAKKRRIRPVPLTSKIPLYDKLMAEKEERSRIVREESVLSLMSQVRPFKLECDRRALRALTRSSPELSCKRIRAGYKGGTADSDVVGAGFKAKPVPKNLFSTDIYDRMIEDEYFRNLQKRIRAAELMKNSSLPPSMARRNRCKSAISLRSQKSLSEERPRSCVTDSRDSVALSRGTPIPSERSRFSAMTSVLPPHGNNLAAILRAQASREKLEREIQEQLEEKRREQLLRLRKALIGRKPAWRALRSAARHEHERDLDFRVSLRRDEAREQAERHRFQMEMMLDRVTRIPTLFERYSQH
ncbi:hypothetical protein TSAR_010825 [Trichomalopsis sarcophagae]|uniref:G-protein coupled receptors family 1 profile domain-containing protein n=1 Tax=Trichomalopsis sarcophagae TaxID=543379 RepID=A0A232EZY1_9HYME|nr:hypothetical protein TSAR_010825 [Trichomalopsis sarcophagae]